MTVETWSSPSDEPYVFPSKRRVIAYQVCAQRALRGNVGVRSARRRARIWLAGRRSCADGGADWVWEVRGIAVRDAFKQVVVLFVGSLNR